MYIDWQRSDFITNNKAFSYANDKVHITGDMSSTKTVSFSNSNINAIANLPKTTELIPTHALIGNKLLEVISNGFDYTSDNGFVKKDINSLSISGTSAVKIGEFNPDQSPPTFKSYLTLYTLDNNVPKFKTYEHIFYLSKIIKTAEQPENFDFYYNHRGDCFLTSKTTGFGKVAAGVGLATAIVGVAALNKNTTDAK